MDIEITRNTLQVTEIESEEINTSQLQLFGERFSRVVTSTWATYVNRDNASWSNLAPPYSAFLDIKLELQPYYNDSIIFYRHKNRIFCGVNMNAKCFTYNSKLFGNYLMSFGGESRSEFVKWGSAIDYGTNKPDVECPYLFKSTALDTLRSKDTYPMELVLTHFDITPQKLDDISLVTYYTKKIDYKNLIIIYFTKL